jgi:hypothetical protein
MSTRALDVVTILHALSRLKSELNITDWIARKPEQKKIIEWLEKFEKDLDRITGLEALASRSFADLNQFLVQHKFDPVIQPFDPATSLGVVSIVDKMIKWLHGPAQEKSIFARGQNQELPGFKLPAGGVNVYSVEGYYNSCLLELLTQSDDTLWIFVHPDLDITSLDIVDLSFEIMAKTRTTYLSSGGFNQGKVAFAGAEVPMIDFDIKPDIGWLLGMGSTTESGVPYCVSQAMQQFKMRIDKTGARVKAATSIVKRCLSISQGPVPFIVDQPFYGWWMQKGIPFPMAAFFADYDCMKKPDGSLEDL